MECSQSWPNPNGKFQHNVFEDIVDQFGSKIALQDDQMRTMTFCELDRQANRFAAYLVSRNVGPEDIIPLYLERSVHTFVAIYGVMKSGAPFCPIDPRTPHERTTFMMKDVCAQFAITDRANLPFFHDHKVLPIVLEDMDLSSYPDERQNIRGLGPQSLIYVLYTSGSTGMPKGVLVTHSAVFAAIGGMIKAMKVDSSWKSLWILNYSFDASYFDVFCVLGAGGSVCIASRTSLESNMEGCINDCQASHLFMTPTISKELNVENLPSVKVLTVAGEAPQAEIKNLWAPRVLVYNAYGPTECTIFCTVVAITPESELSLLGHPLGDTALMVLDTASMAPADFGAVGELCISGSQVARGYLNHPKTTQAAFVPFESRTILYRTGDLARLREDGKIDLLGRKDDQVKVNGYRVELGEVEKAILRTNLVSSCVVIAPYITGKRRLVACCVLTPTRQSDTAIDTMDSILLPKQTQSFIEILPRLTTLPAFVTPSLWLPVAFMPRSTSGKTDKKKLSNIVEAMPSEIIHTYKVCL